jgi:hypothetical protein
MFNIWVFTVLAPFFIRFQKVSAVLRYTKNLVMSMSYWSNIKSGQISCAPTDLEISPVITIFVTDSPKTENLFLNKLDINFLDWKSNIFLYSVWFISSKAPDCVFYPCEFRQELSGLDNKQHFQVSLTFLLKSLLQYPQ